MVPSAIFVLFFQVFKELFNVRVVIRAQHSHPCDTVVQPERGHGALDSLVSLILGVEYQ